MSFVEEHREATRRQCAMLVKAGPGVHAYVLHKARTLEQEFPEFHTGLTEFVKAVLGAKALRIAERDIGILLGKREAMKA